jgi:cell division protein FtsI/penicillin-binding protein 2
MSMKRLSTGLISGAIALATAVSVAQSPSSIVSSSVSKASHAANVEHTSKLGSEVGISIQNAALAFKPVEIARVPENWAEAGLDITKAKNVDGKLVQVLSDGSKVTFTVDPSVQERLERLLVEKKVPHSGVVLMEPQTGRIKAFVSHTQHNPPIEDFAIKSAAPSASVFKVITAAALIEAGHDPNASVCYHGGRSFLSAENIKGNPRKDHKCNSLGPALAWSINSIFAKLSYNHLKKADLEVWAERFGYNSPIPFELPVEVSTAEFVEDPLERARSAAGFWHTYLSPLHGAMIGGALKNDGVMMRPSIIEKYESADGTELLAFEPKVYRRVMRPETARKLGELMVQTTTEGTARKYFKHRRGFPDHITVSGKTGTLSNKNPYLGFTWFVGYASDSHTKKDIAVSGLVANTPIWHIKGGFAASEAVLAYFQSEANKKGLAQR